MTRNERAAKARYDKSFIPGGQAMKPVQGRVVKWNKEQTAYLRERLKSVAKPRRKKSLAKKLRDYLWENCLLGSNPDNLCNGRPTLATEFFRDETLAAILKFYPEDADDKPQ